MRQNPKGGPPLPIGQRWHHQPLLRTFRAVFRTTLFPVFDALGVQNATQYVVTDTGKVFYTAATDQDNRVLLKVVAFARDVADDFETVGQANLRNTTHGRVRFLRRCCINACANAALLRAFLQVRRFRTSDFRLARLADQLLDRWHSGFFPVLHMCCGKTPRFQFNRPRVHGPTQVHPERCVIRCAKRANAEMTATFPYRGERCSVFPEERVHRRPVRAHFISDFGTRAGRSLTEMTRV